MSLQFRDNQQYEVRLLQDQPDGKKDTVLLVPGNKARELIAQGIAAPIIRADKNNNTFVETR